MTAPQDKTATPLPARWRRQRARRRLAQASDADLIDRSRFEPEVFATIFDRHAPAIHNYSRRRVGPDSAEDVVMATFTAAFDQRTRFVAPDHKSARPWLFGIASNLVKQHYRGTSRLKALRQHLSSLPTADTTDPDIGELLDIADALEVLSEEERETLLLVALAELSYEETAETLGVPIGTVRSRVNRARKRLRTQRGTDGTERDQP